jgi:hypothetical protein
VCLSAESGFGIGWVIPSCYWGTFERVDTWQMMVININTTKNGETAL